MSAKVEGCFGKRAFERMKVCLNLVSLKLWGEYEGVELFLEIENHNAVYHPQFFYHGQTSESGLQFRKKLARTQDLQLFVAGKLGGIKITPNFYESKHVPDHYEYGQFDNASNYVVKRLEKKADDQLRIAFPQEHKKIEASSRAVVENVKIERPTTVVQLSTMYGKHVPPTTNSTAYTPPD